MRVSVGVGRVVVLAGLLCVVLGVLPGVAGAGSCSNERLRAEQGDLGLPDCRAYELVSPSDKGATTPLFSGGAIPLTAVGGDGSRVWLAGLAVYNGPSPAGPLGVNAVMSRTDHGWAFSSLQPSELGDETYWPNVFSSNLTTVGIETRVEKQVYVHSPEHRFVVGPSGGPYAPVATLSFSEENGSFLAGASEDGSRVVLASSDHTLAAGVSEAVSGAHDLYEWSGHGECKPAVSGCVRVNVTSAGSPVGGCGAELGRTAKTESTAVGFTTPVSEDGSKIFFTAPDETMRGSSEVSCNEPLRLYMRVNGRETVEISAPQEGVEDPTGLHDAYFLGATLDGTHVWFVSETELTQDDKGIHDRELYEYNTLTRKLLRVSRGETSTAEANMNETQDEHEIAFSKDGSVLYFKAQGKLTANTPSAVTKPTFNIYRYDTVSGATRYVATTSEVGGNYIPLNSSVDGRALVFDGKEETTGPNGVVYNEGVDQLFRYDAVAESVVCVSCPAKGTVADGQARSILGEVTLNETFSNGIIEYEVSNDGRYVAFTSKDALVPQDTTEEEGEGYGPASDVYEWEAAGAGSCVSVGGCLSLISRPDSGHGSIFLGMGADGRDLIFATYSALVPQDVDTVTDIYDARIGGGFAVSGSVPCSGEGCRLVGGAPPTFGSPQSFAFYGAGNPVAPVGTRVVHKHKKKVRKRVRRHRRGRGGRRGRAGRTVVGGVGVGKASGGSR
jgi:hypothetical protein